MSTIISSGISNTEAYNGGTHRTLFFVNDRWYTFYNNGTTLYYRKSTDAAGTGWGSEVTVQTGGAYGVSGRLVGNIIWVTWDDTSPDVIGYRSLNTATDTLGTIYQAPSESGYTSTDFNDIAISGGTKYLVNSNIPTVWKTTNDSSYSDITPALGGNFGDVDRAASLIVQGSNIWYISGPGSFFDKDIKVIAYNGTTWGSITSLLTPSNYDSNTALTAVGKGNNVYVAFNDAGTVKVFKYNGTSWFASTSATTGAWASVFSTDSDGQQAVSLSIDDNTEDVYIFYRKNSDSKTYYRISSDLKSSTPGAPSCTWGTETDTGFSTGMEWVQSNANSVNRIGVRAWSGSGYEFQQIAVLSPGGTTAYEDRSFRLAAEGIGYEDRSLRLKATDTGYSDRSFRLTAFDVGYEDRSFRLKADQTGYEDRGFRLNLSTVAYEDRDFHLKATDTGYEDRSFYLTLEETTYEDRNFRMKVGDLFDGYEDRSFRLVLRSTDYEDRNVIIKVDEINHEDRNFRLTLEETGYKDVSFRLYLAQNTFEDRRYRLKVDEIAHTDRNFVIGVYDIPGTFPAHEDRAFHLGLEGDQWIDTGDKVTTFTDTADVTSTWTDTTDSSTDWTDTT